MLDAPLPLHWKLTFILRGLRWEIEFWGTFSLPQEVKTAAGVLKKIISTKLFRSFEVSQSSPLRMNVSFQCKGTDASCIIVVKVRRTGNLKPNPAIRLALGHEGKSCDLSCLHGALLTNHMGLAEQNVYMRQTNFFADLTSLPTTLWALVSSQCSG